MRRLGRWHLSLELALTLCVAGFVLFGVTRCHAMRDGAADARIAHAQAMSYRLAVAYRSQRDTTDKLGIAYIQSSDKLARTEGRLARVDARFRQTLDSLGGILADSNASRDALRSALGTALQEAATYRMSVSAYRDSVQSYRSATDALVAAFDAERQAADSALRAKQSEVDALTDAATGCKIVGIIPCPSRTQSFFAGGGAVLLLLIL